MQSVTSKDLNEALLEKGIIMDKHRLSYHIRFNELNGTLQRQSSSYKGDIQSHRKEGSKNSQAGT